MPADQDTADVPGRNAGRSGHGTNFTKPIGLVKPSICIK